MIAGKFVLRPPLDVRDTDPLVLRCADCAGWRKATTMGRRERDWAAHLKGSLHTRRNRKNGPQQKTLDKHAGRLR